MQPVLTLPVTTPKNINFDTEQKSKSDVLRRRFPEIRTFVAIKTMTWMRRSETNRMRPPRFSTSLSVTLLYNITIRAKIYIKFQF